MKFLLLFFIIFSFYAFLPAQPEIWGRVDLGEIEHQELTEASGLVESRVNDHVLWSHNDRNHVNRIFAFNVRGIHLGIFWIEGVENRDWEDIALGPGPEEGVDYLYIGDIGDNDAVHEFKYIYRFPEPEISFDQSPVEESIYDFDTIIYQYPDGPRDSETLMIDPLTKDIYVVSKREFEDIRVYRAPYPQPVDEVIILEQVATLALSQIVGGDISVTGDEILLKNYQYVYYWERNLETDLWEAFDNDPVILPYVEEVQGEAICWAADSKGYFTLSEEGMWLPAHLFYYPRVRSSPVVVNEIMQDPAFVADEQGEWIELYNNSEEAVDLYNWIIKDADVDLHVIQESILLYPEDFLVLGINSDFNTNGGVVVDYQYSDFHLDNTVDEILVFSPDGSLVDSLIYDDGTTFPHQEGAAMALLNVNMDNGCGLNWRSATSDYGLGDLGTPGSDNSGTIPELLIRDIQYTPDPSGHSDYLDRRVTLSGTLSIEPFGFQNNTFFIQDSLGMWSGIMVQHAVSAVDQDSVRLTGTVAEAFGDLTIIIGIEEFEILGNGTIDIDPLQVTSGEIGADGENCEAYESVLVLVSGVCDNDNLGWKEWSIDDGSGPVRIYHALIEDFTPVTGAEYLVSGILYFRNGNFKVLPRFITDIEGPAGIDDGPVAMAFRLEQNYPNPFNPLTVIKYSLSGPSDVELNIFNIKGQLIKSIMCPDQEAGVHTVNWNGRNNHDQPVSSGIYFYKLDAGMRSFSRKMILLR